LLTAYGGERLCVPRPAVEAMFTITPERCSTITRAAACMQKKRPRALTAIVRSQSSSVT
jgi:hypothetical protein